MALKAICALTVEDPYVRKTLDSRECEEILRHLQNLTKDEFDRNIVQWASSTFSAIESEEVHDLWSNVITKPVSRRDMQQLSNGSVAGNTGVLAELAKSLRYV